MQKNLTDALFVFTLSRVTISCMKSWKQWPYWLKGGVIGGGVAFLFYFLLYGCFFATSIDLKPGEVGSTYYCLVFFVISPIYPVGLLLNLLGPIFDYSSGFVEAYAPILSIPIWFIIGSIVGALVGYIKIKKSRQ